MQWADLGCRAVSLIWLLIMRQLEKKGGKITSLPGWLSKSSQSHPAGGRHGCRLSPLSLTAAFLARLRAAERFHVFSQNKDDTHENLNTAPSHHSALPRGLPPLKSAN